MCKCLSEKEFGILLSNSSGSGKTARHRQHLRICDTCAGRLAELRIGSKGHQGTVTLESTRGKNNMSFRLTLEPNIEIGDFRIEKRLGAGGMGVVYQAYQMSLKRRVALKVLGGNLLTNESAVERFHREARAAAKLQNSNIVSIYEEGVEDGLCYYAMELVEGKSLSELIAEIREKKSEQDGLSDTKTKLTEIFDTRFGLDSKLTKSSGSKKHFDNIARVITEAADALDYAHQNGVIHRDIKPSNLILSNDGRLMITDFGIARVIDDNALTITGSFLGTPLYMSPEQISESSNVDHRTDIYSLGATLYEWLTLQPLFQGLKTHEQAIIHILNKMPAKPRSIDENIPMDLETICCKAIDGSPDRRYQSAGEFADDLRRFINRQVIKAKPAGAFDKVSKFVVRHKIASALSCGILIVVAIAASFAWRNFQDHRVQEIIPRITQLIEQKKFFDAFVLAKKIERIQPDTPMLEEFWPKMTRDYSVTSDPAGADVYIRDYFNDESDWVKIGLSPLEDVRIPFGTQSWRVEKEGFVPRLVARSNEFSALGGSKTSEKGIEVFYLQEVGKYPEDMVWIPASDLRRVRLFHNHVNVGERPAFLIDKYEVTNKQFKEFVDQGGYANVKYWEIAFIKDEEFLTWKEAMSLFVDPTGKHGPSSWVNGSYAEGQGDYPVSGVSWYEAVAYAKFRDKDIPTVFHWLWAAIGRDAQFRIIQRSNFSDSIAPTGTYKGMGRFGIYDCAGNVREWCYNSVDTDDGPRCIFGGGYSDPTYLFRGNTCVTPWNRDIKNGFRCVRYLGGKDKVPDIAFDFLVRIERDMSKFTPLPEETVQNYIDTLYQYDKSPLNPLVDSSEELDNCRLERVSYDAAYPERIIAMLFIPKNAKPPYQTVIWFPGAGAIKSPWKMEHRKKRMIHIIESGRAVILPFYQGTFDRRIENSNKGTESIASRNLNIQRALDLRRSIDYIEWRQDLDGEKVAYAGLSWGGSIGPLMMAIEDRIKTGVYLLGGICGCKFHPACDTANFLRFVKAPVLMINGREDSTHTHENRIYMFDALGTPAKDKKQVLFPGGHGISWEFRDEYNKTILDWLDRYLGPVELLGGNR